VPVTLGDAIRRCRAALNEPAAPTLPNTTATYSARQYTDTELTDWINDGLRDIARRAEVLLTNDSSITLPAQSVNPNAPVPTFPLNLGGPPAVPGSTVAPSAYSDVIRINRVEFAVNSLQIYPLEAASPQYLDQIWNINQISNMSYPSWYCTRGYPGGTGRNAFSIQVFPLPAQAGTLNIWYYRMPARIPDPVANPAAYTQTLDCLDGWEDMVIDFVMMRALIKVRSADWQIAQALYEAKVTNIVDATRHFHDQPTYIGYDTMVMPWTGGGW
jgi:hypothetical protein